MTRDVTFSLEQPDANRLVARLREGNVTTEVTGWRPEQAATHLMSALDAADADGYGEGFWFEPTGQYWWMFRREDRSLEVVVLWSRSSAVGWQHVFRAADEAGYVRDMVRAELTRLALI